MYYLGIDGGLAGYLALIDDKSNVIGSWPMPLDKRRKFDPRGVWDLFQKIEGIAVEQFEDVTVGLEGLLSLPSDTNRTKLLLDKYAENHSKETLAEIYKNLKRTDGRKGSVTMGSNHGALIGCLCAMGWKYVIPSPRSWQSVMWKCCSSKGPAKMKSYEVAQMLWPKEDLCTGKRQGFNDGKVDALCVAEYTRRLLK